MTILLLLPLFLSCSGAKESDVHDVNAETFIPLAVGNQWVYNYGLDANPTRQQVTIVGKTHRGEQTWYQAEYKFVGDSSADTLLLRNDGHRHIMYLVQSEEELVIIDFSRNHPDSTSMESSYVKEQDKTVTVEGKTYNRCVVVAPAFVDGEVGTYAPGTGLVEAWWFRGRKQLLNATIAGKKVGE